MIGLEYAPVDVERNLDESIAVAAQALACEVHEALGVGLRVRRRQLAIGRSLRDPDGYVIELFQFTGDDQSDAPLREPIRS